MPSPAIGAASKPSPLDGVVEAFKGGYYALEDRYYNLLDRLSAYIPVYSIVDPIDRVLPSFIVFSLLLVALFVGFGFIVLTTLFGGYSAGIHVVTADGLPVEGARIELLSEIPINGESGWDANADGFASFHLRNDAEYSFRVTALDFEPATITSAFTAADPFVTVVLVPKEVVVSNRFYRLEVQDFSTNQPIFSMAENRGKEGSARLFCQSTSTLIAVVPITESSVRLSALNDSSCAQVQVSVEFPGYQKSPTQSIQSEVTTVSLRKVAPQQVNLTVRAMDQNGSSPLAGLKVIVTGSTTIAPQLTDSSGTTVFALSPAIYTVRVVDESAAYEQPADQSVDLSGGSNSEKIFVLKKATPSSQKKIFLRMFDSNSRAVVQAWVSLYQGNVLLETARSTNGDYSYALADGNQNFVYSAVISHEDYISKILSPVPVRPLNDPKPTDVNLVRIMVDTNGNPVNAFQLNVKVLADNNSPVSGAHVQLFDKRFSFPVDQGDSLDNGLYRFFNLPAATYYATADEQGASGRSIDVNGRSGEVKDVNIILVLGTVTVRATVVTAGNIPIADANVVFTTNLDQNAFVQLTSAQGIASGAFKVNRIVTIRVDKAGYESVQLPPIDLHGLREPAVQNVRVVLFPLGDDNSNLSLRLIGIMADNQTTPVTTLRKGESYWLQYRLRAKDSSTNATTYLWTGLPNAALVDTIAPITGVSPGATSYAYYPDANADTAYATNTSTPLSQPPAKRLLLNYDALSARVAKEFWVRISVSDAASIPSDANVSIFFGSKTAAPSQVTPDYFKSFQLGKPICLVLGIGCPPIVVLPKLHQRGQPTDLAIRNGFYELSTDFNYDFSYSLYNASTQNYTTLSTHVNQSAPTAILLDRNVFVLTGGLQPSQTAQSHLFLAQPVLESANASFRIVLDDLNLSNDANRVLVPIKVVPKKMLQVNYSKLFKDVPTPQSLLVRVLDASDREPVENALVSASFTAGEFTPDLTGTTDANGQTTLLLDVGSRELVYLRIMAPGFNESLLTLPISSFDSGTFVGDPEWPCLEFVPVAGGDALQDIRVNKGEGSSFKVTSSCEAPMDVSLFVETAPTLDCYPSLLDETHGTLIPYANGQSLPIVKLSPASPSNEYRFTGDCLKGVYGIRIKARPTSTTQDFSLGSRMLAYVGDVADDCFSISDSVFDLSTQSYQSGRITNRCPFALPNLLIPDLSLQTDRVYVNRQHWLTSSISFNWQATLHVDCNADMAITPAPNPAGYVGSSHPVTVDLSTYDPQSPLLVGSIDQSLIDQQNYYDSTYNDPLHDPVCFFNYTFETTFATPGPQLNLYSQFQNDHQRNVYGYFIPTPSSENGSIDFNVINLSLQGDQYSLMQVKDYTDRPMQSGEFTYFDSVDFNLTVTAQSDGNSISFSESIQADGVAHRIGSISDYDFAHHLGPYVISTDQNSVLIYFSDTNSLTSNNPDANLMAIVGSRIITNQTFRKVDLVFLVDTSGSLDVTWKTVCNVVDGTFQTLADRNITVAKAVFSMGSRKSCATRAAKWGAITQGRFNGSELIEAWAPTGIDVMNKHEWQQDAYRLLVVVTDNAPGGRDNGEDFWKTEANTKLVDEMIAKAKEKNVHVFFSRLQKLEGQNDTLKDRYKNPEKIDTIETYEDVANATGGRVDIYNAGNVQINSDVNIDTISYAILLGVYPASTEKFHLLFQSGLPACYGPTNVAGQAGPLAVPQLSWDWEWDLLNEDTCSLVRLDGVQNPNHAYCDSVQFSTVLMKRLAKMSQALEDQNIAEFEKRQSFLVALKKDGFTADFRHDYNIDLHAQFLAGSGIEFFTHATTGFQKVFADESAFKMKLIENESDYLSDESHYTLRGPGIYSVQIVPSFTNPNVPRFYVNGMHNVSLRIYLKKIDDPRDNNPFYYLPFDGRVGFDATSGRFERNGYGVSFDSSAAGSTVPIYQRVAPLYTLQTYPGTALTEGITSQWARDIASVNGPNRGIVLSASYNNAAQQVERVQFSPSLPAPVIVRVQGTQGTPAAFGYTLRFNDTGSLELANFPDSINFASQWTQIASSNRTSVGNGLFACQSFNGYPAIVNQSDARMTSSNACNFDPFFDQKVFGIDLGNARTAENYYRTTFYRPVGKSLYIQQSCNFPTVTYYSPAGTTSAASPLLSLMYNPQTNGGPFPTLPDWKAIFDYASTPINVRDAAGSQEIFAGYPLCVYKNAGEISFFWNNEFVRALEKTALNPPIGENMCPLPIYAR